MKTIYKLSITGDVNTSGKFTIRTHRNAKALFAGLRGDQRTMWMEADTSGCLEDIKLCIVGTGKEVPDGYDYVGSFFEHDFVWQLYQEVKEK